MQVAAIVGDEPEVTDEQQENAAEIAQGPTKTAHPANIFFGGYLVEHGEIAHLAKFVGHGSDGQDGDSQPEIDGVVVADEIQRQHDDDGDERPHPNASASGAAGVGSLTNDRCQQGDKQAANANGDG